MKSIHRPSVVAILSVLAGVSISCADREAYSERDSTWTQTGKMIAYHLHDYGEESRDLRLRLHKRECGIFGSENDYSLLAVSVDGGRHWNKSPSPPLHFLKIDAKRKLVIGLSRIKLQNAYNAVVFDFQGRLQYSASIVDETFGFRNAELASFSHDDSVWLGTRGVFLRQNDSTYFNFDWKAIWDSARSQFALRHMRPNPFAPNARASVTNFIHWFDESNPKPSLLFRGDSAYLRVRDQEGIFRQVPLTTACRAS